MPDVWRVGNLVGIRFVGAGRAVSFLVLGFATTLLDGAFGAGADADCTLGVAAGGLAAGFVVAVTVFLLEIFFASFLALGLGAIFLAAGLATRWAVGAGVDVTGWRFAARISLLECGSTGLLASVDLFFGLSNLGVMSLKVFVFGGTAGVGTAEFTGLRTMGALAPVA